MLFVGDKYLSLQANAYFVLKKRIYLFTINLIINQNINSHEEVFTFDAPCLDRSDVEQC